MNIKNEKGRPGAMMRWMNFVRISIMEREIMTKMSVKARHKTTVSKGLKTLTMVEN